MRSLVTKLGFSLMSIWVLLISPSAGTQMRTTTSNMGFTHQGMNSNIRTTTRGQPINPLPANLPLNNPYFSIYYGPLYEPYDQPCYYDEYYGQWIGPCTTSLDTPGYSITVPNRVR